MKRLIKYLVALPILSFSTPAMAQTNPTVRVPLCLQYPDRKAYVPCTGVVPVDKTTGDVLDWSLIFKGSKDQPIFTQETTRRTHWSESSTPLGSSQVFEGISHDDGADYSGGSTRSTSFSCFVTTDQSGTLMIQGSDNGTQWVTYQARPIVADTGMYLVQPLFTRYWRCRVVNGGVPQTTLTVKSAFGM